MQALSLEQFQSSGRDIAAVKHFLRESIEAMIDIGSHITVKQAFGTPSSGVDVIVMLRDNGVLPQDHADTCVRMVKYRNRLVHFYPEVTTEELWNILQNHLPDIEKFIADIASYVGSLS